jgi:hypothetical protein
MSDADPGLMTLIAEAIMDGVPGARQKNQGIALFLG